MDGDIVGESAALLRYAASLSGLMPSDPFEVALCDNVVGVADDIFTWVRSWFHAADEKKAEVEKEVLSKLPGAFELFEKFVAKHSKGNDKLVSKRSYADVLIFTLIEGFLSDAIPVMPKSVVADGKVPLPAIMKVGGRGEEGGGGS